MDVQIFLEDRTDHEIDVELEYIFDIADWHDMMIYNISIIYFW